MAFQDLLKQYAEVRIEKNYSKFEPYFSHNPIYMFSLVSLRWEILNCLILDFHNASITLTNHFVERMLKLSLIQLETKGITFSDAEKYSRRVMHAHNQYDHLKLHDTIKHNKNKKLISEDEFLYLNTVCKIFRDSYSHAQVAIINKKPEKFSGFMFSIDDVKQKLIKGETNFDKKEIEIPKHSPTMAQFYQTQSSRENALDYFAKVYEILINIEKRLDDI